MEKPNELNEINFAESAQEVINDLINTARKDNYGNKQIVTNSQLRNLLAKTNSLSNQAKRVKGEELNDKIIGDIKYVEMQFAYAAGRDDIVKDFIKKAGLIEHIGQVGKSKEKLVIFCKYMESLVAYHKYYGGKD